MLLLAREVWMEKQEHNAWMLIIDMLSCSHAKQLKDMLLDQWELQMGGRGIKWFAEKNCRAKYCRGTQL